MLGGFFEAALGTPLLAPGAPLLKLHGDMVQAERTSAFVRFTQARARRRLIGSARPFFCFGPHAPPRPLLYAHPPSLLPSHANALSFTLATHPIPE